MKINNSVTMIYPGLCASCISRSYLISTQINMAQISLFPTSGRRWLSQYRTLRMYYFLHNTIFQVLPARFHLFNSS